MTTPPPSNLLSVMNADDLRFAILSGDAAAISKAPGVGAKTAQRVIIDLKDKIDIAVAFEDNINHASGSDSHEANLGGIREEAAQALMALGYSQSASYKAVRSVGDAEDVETVLKKALTVISGL